MATRMRSLAKTITYRLSGSLITASITLLVTNKLTLAIGLGITEVTIKLFFYYIHERLWDNFNWGKTELSSEQLPKAHLDNFVNDSTIPCPLKQESGLQV